MEGFQISNLIGINSHFQSDASHLNPPFGQDNHPILNIQASFCLLMPQYRVDFLANALNPRLSLLGISWTSSCDTL